MRPSALPVCNGPDTRRVPEITLAHLEYAGAPSLGQLGDLDGIGSGGARTTEDGVFDDEGPPGGVLTEELQDEGPRLGVVLAYGPAAEPTGRNGSTSAMPAVHAASWHTATSGRTHGRW